MTREEKINDASETYMNGLFEDGVEIPNEDYENIFDAFCQGAEWADKYPKSPWISVKDDLPCNHEELMEPICQLDNRLIYETKRVFVHCSNNSFDTAHMINFYNRWKWYPEDIDVEHWFPIPELPKE